MVKCDYNYGYGYGYGYIWYIGDLSKINKCENK